MRWIRSERWGPVAASILFAVAFALVLVVGAYVVHHQRLVNAELCHSTVDNRMADRVQWLTLERLSSVQMTDPEQRRAFHLLIQGVLRPIPVLECRDNKPVPKEG